VAERTEHQAERQLGRGHRIDLAQQARTGIGA